MFSRRKAVCVCCQEPFSLSLSSPRTLWFCSIVMKISTEQQFSHSPNEGSGNGWEEVVYQGTAFLLSLFSYSFFRRPGARFDLIQESFFFPSDEDGEKGREWEVDNFLYVPLIEVVGWKRKRRKQPHVFRCRDRVIEGQERKVIKEEEITRKKSEAGRRRWREKSQSSSHILAVLWIFTIKCEEREGTGWRASAASCSSCTVFIQQCACSSVVPAVIITHSLPHLSSFSSRRLLPVPVAALSRLQMLQLHHQKE